MRTITNIVTMDSLLIKAALKPQSLKEEEVQQCTSYLLGSVYRWFTQRRQTPPKGEDAAQSVWVGLAEAGQHWNKNKEEGFAPFSTMYALRAVQDFYQSNGALTAPSDAIFAPKKRAKGGLIEEVLQAPASLEVSQPEGDRVEYLPVPGQTGEGDFNNAETELALEQFCSSAKIKKGDFVLLLASKGKAFSLEEYAKKFVKGWETLNKEEQEKKIASLQKKAQRLLKKIQENDELKEQLIEILS